MFDRQRVGPCLDKSQVQASFGNAAANYDRWAALQRRIGDRLIGYLDQKTSDPAAILDLGSGTGYCSRQIHRAGRTVIDLDIAPGMLRRARSLHDRHTLYVCGDAESLPIQEKCFDLVLSNLALQWCENIDLVFDEVHRVLKPGGIFLFSTFGPRTLVELRKAWENVDLDRHVNEFLAGNEIQQALSGSGFDQARIDRDLLSVDYPDVMHLMRELKGLGAHNINPGRPRALTGKKKLSKMIANYKKINLDQSIIATFELILGRGTRPCN